LSVAKYRIIQMAKGERVGCRPAPCLFVIVWLEASRSSAEELETLGVEFLFLDRRAGGSFATQV
jgi:hypothetical protein